MGRYRIFIFVLLILVALSTIFFIFFRKFNTKSNFGLIEDIPNNYRNLAEKQGTLVELYYDTFESKDYDKKEKIIHKRAIVYLPYGYDENKKYNIFYFMHGLFGDETTSLGTPDNPTILKNIIDNAIQDNKMVPMIIVCPTYNNENPKDSINYELSNILTANYYNELVNDLIPAVENHYSNKNTSQQEGVVVSREYRGFGGFSMGSIATWHVFVNCLDKFKYFVPISGVSDNDDSDKIDRAVTELGYKTSDFFIFSFTGTNDFMHSKVKNQIDQLLEKDSHNFITGDNQFNGNLYLGIKNGYSHDFEAMMTYLYSGLLHLWK